MIRRLRLKLIFIDLSKCFKISLKCIFSSRSINFLISKTKTNNSGFLMKRKYKEGEFIVKFTTNNPQSL